MFSIIYTATLMSVIFGSYMTIYSLITTEYHNIGFLAQGLIYFGNLIGSIIAPFIVYYLIGIKWTIVLGSITYIFWGPAFLTKKISLLFVISFINGIGNGLFRTQQAVWINSLDLPDDKLWLAISIYNMIFNTYGILGSGFSLIIFFNDISIDMMLFILMIVSIVSFIGMLFISNPPLKIEHFVNIRTINQWVVNRVNLLIPAMALQAFTMIYNYSVLPLLFDSYLEIMIYFLILHIVKVLTTIVVGCLYRYSVSIFMFNSVMVSCQVLLISLNKYNYICIFAGIVEGIVENIILLKLSYDYSDKSVFVYHRSIYCVFCIIFASLLYIPYIADSIYIISFTYLILNIITVILTSIYDYKQKSDQELIVLI